MPNLQELVAGMTPEERQLKAQEVLQAIKQREAMGETRQTQNPLLRGLKGMARAFPSIALEGKLPAEEKTTDEPSFYEKELFKHKLKDTGKRRVGLVHPVTGEITETETDADVVLKGALQKDENELTPNDLINIYRILESTKETSGFFGIGSKKLSPEQEMLRERARALLERKQDTIPTDNIEEAQITETPEKSPYSEYPDAFLEDGVWKVIREGKKYRIQE